MSVSVNPERNAAIEDEFVKVRDKRGTEGTACIIRILRFSAGRMVRNDDRPGRIVLGQFLPQPGDGYRMQPDGVPRAQDAVTEFDNSEIVNHGFRGLHTWDGTSTQREVGPERATENCPAQDFDRPIFQ